jgi:hypothetical protein
MSKKQKGRAPPQQNVLAGHGGPISEINENDVLCGRGQPCYGHSGSVKFRDKVEKLTPKYLTSENADKKHLAAELVTEIRSADPPGRFLETTVDGMYKEIGDKRAWESEYLFYASIQSFLSMYTLTNTANSIIYDVNRGYVNIATICPGCEKRT